MTKWISTIALTTCLALAVSVVSAQSPALEVDAKTAKLNPKVLTELNAAMQKQVDDHHVSGVIAILARNGKLGYYKTFGQRVIERKAPMTKDTLFRIYSMTKPIVAVTAMSLWEEGKFKLDDPISNHLPEWKNATVREKGEVVPAKTPVTVRNLMTHSIGVSYDRKDLDLGPNTSLKKFSESVAKRPLRFHPGTSYMYGYAIDILGRYIEAIEKKSLDVVMRERVLDKLGMNDTEFWVRNPKHQDRVAHVYGKKMNTIMSPKGMMNKPTRMMGGQGLMSTAADYALFCQMFANKGILDGKRVLKAATIELMCQNHLKKIGKVYGLGGTVNGKGFYAWGGAAGTKFWIDTSSNSYMVFMIQRWGYNPPTVKVFNAHVKRAFGH
jgi:CubicO group peptidase (beta-lactamase class C family)